MNSNEKILSKFYTAFANGDAKSMCKCYHSNIKFTDPIFGLLVGNDVCQMWKMLFVKSKETIKVEFSIGKIDQYRGSATWIATYKFGKKNRKVINKVYSEFQFKDGLIIKQFDHFNIWLWSKQAFGIIGYLFGWTGYFQRKIEEKASLSLKKYQNAS
ncbi:nuclear transport factor 2 family protein [Flavobacterium weaverense]|uniref:SnoaL-like domain-containing protein n=1 Tax=Flavobacterium weaverense TaxID=271156 RepID=A0A3L9ZKJ4_9FLAO|nr:nuclear transport factor 2 family protein [Flavobacterium weaverense]RMA72760.1 hypothetical protein BC961_2825 [Flavobacterium weaverense]